jgi:hypothetical protein
LNMHWLKSSLVRFSFWRQSPGLLRRQGESLSIGMAFGDILLARILDTIDDMDGGLAFCLFQDNLGSSLGRFQTMVVLSPGLGCWLIRSLCHHVLFHGRHHHRDHRPYRVLYRHLLLHGRLCLQLPCGPCSWAWGRRRSTGYQEVANRGGCSSGWLRRGCSWCPD